LAGGPLVPYCVSALLVEISSELREREEAAPALLYLEPPCSHSMRVVTGTCCV